MTNGQMAEVKHSEILMNFLDFALIFRSFLLNIGHLTLNSYFSYVL